MEKTIPLAIEEATIKQIHSAMTTGHLTCRDLTIAYLERIAAYDRQGPCLNAVITINPRAVEIAEELDHRLQTEGLSGSLHGIPLVLKDNIAAKGMATTGGSISLAGFAPPFDSFITERLIQAGALILAKVNLHEFAAWGETISSITGQTLNPYDLTRTPGGSSGGTGAAVAAGFAVAGIGTDTVNSVRSPASANALVGLHPTLGLISRQGIIPYSLTQDTAGPITRSVEDAAIILDVIAGYDPADSKTSDSAGHIPASYQVGLVPKGLQQKRIGILRSFFGTRPEHSEVNSIMTDSLAILQQEGALLYELSDALDSGDIVTQISVHHHEMKEDLNRFLAETKAPVTSLTEILASGQYHPYNEETFRRAALLSPDSEDYHDRLKKRDALEERILAIMAEHSLDAIVYPHQQHLVVKTGCSQTGRNGGLAAVLGYPAITVPAGFSAPTADAPLGVPVGIEFMSRPWSEPLLLSIAYAFEQATAVRKSPVSTPPLG